MDRDFVVDAIVYFVLALGLPYLVVCAYRFIRDNFFSR